MRLAPVVEVAGPPGPLLRVKLRLDRHHIVAHTQRPAGEAALPAQVSVWQPDAGHHILPAEKNDNKDAGTRRIIIQASLSSEVHEAVLWGVGGGASTPSRLPSGFCLVH